MSFTNLFNMQGMLFTLMLLGAFLKRRGIISNEGKKMLGDMVIFVILPCNIYQSFQTKLSSDMIGGGITVFVMALVTIFVSIILNQFLYNKQGDGRKKVLQYGTISSNSGILGNTIAESIYGPMGLFYAALYLIPLRTCMWSYCMTFFTEAPDKKTLLKKVVTHPCIVAVFVGLVSMVPGFRIPGFLSLSISYISRANTATSMIFVGTILAEAKPEHFKDPLVFYYTAIRLGLIPLISFVILKAIHADPLATSVSVVLAAMPMAASTAIMAAKYDRDALFATECVVFSTLVSMITLPLWCLALSYI